MGFEVLGFSRPFEGYIQFGVWGLGFLSGSIYIYIHRHTHNIGFRDCMRCVGFGVKGLGVVVKGSIVLGVWGCIGIAVKGHFRVQE